LLRDPTFDRRLLWNAPAARRGLLGVFALMVGAGTGMVLGLALLRPEWLSSLPIHRPGLWLLLLLVYAIVVAYPQEVIYRAFLFHRYRPVFGEGPAMIAASAAAFGYAHVLCGNPVAVLLALALGLLFAWRYQTSRSLLLVTIEHALYAALVLTVGLGQFFGAG
jgi:membrane protease YdiL (CAAX protease family)